MYCWCSLVPCLCKHFLFYALFCSWLLVNSNFHLYFVGALFWNTYFDHTLSQPAFPGIQNIWFRSRQFLRRLDHFYNSCAWKVLWGESFHMTMDHSLFLLLMTAYCWFILIVLHCKDRGMCTIGNSIIKPLSVTSQNQEKKQTQVDVNSDKICWHMMSPICFDNLGFVHFYKHFFFLKFVVTLLIVRL